MATVYDRLRWFSPAQQKSNAKKILFTKVPDANNLLLIVSWYDVNEKENHFSTLSFHQYSNLKCRKLIFSEQNIIASPEDGEYRKIYILVSKIIYNSQSKIDSLMKKHNLNYHEPTAVTRFVYEACLRYTITARISPMWNKVENFFVQGRDFITKYSPTSAVKLDVFIVGDELQLVMWAFRVCFSPVVLDAFDLTESAEDPGNQVLDITPYQINVYVLPSMKLAAATYIQTKIPASSNFKSYKEVRRYWKNMYGYRLPEIDEKEKKMVYVTVKFASMQSPLTYPLTCLRAFPAVTITPKNETEILMDFLADISNRIPHICGYPFSIDTEVGVAVSELTHPKMLSEKPNISFIPLENFTRIHPQFLVDKDESKSVFRNSSNNDNYMQHDEDEDEEEEEHDDDDEEEEEYDDEDCLEKEIKPFINWTCNASTSLQDCNSSIITAFNNKCFNGATLSKCCHSTPLPPPVVPSFSSPVGKSTSTQVCGQLKNIHNEIHKSNSGHYMKQSMIHCGNFNTSATFNDKNNLLHCPKYVPVFHPHSRPAVKTTATMTSMSYINNNNNINHYPQQQLLSRESTPSCSQISAPKVPTIPSFINNTKHNVSATAKDKTLTMSSLLRREPCAFKNYEGGVKKRSRPQVQADIDVKAMARSSEGLTRVNTTTLIAYLRSQGIHCKVKDKKGDLVAKVMMHLNSQK